MPLNTEELITSRALTHGTFGYNADTFEAFMQILEPRLLIGHPTYVRFALRMILVKMSRILHGDPRFLDHWKDIAGYTRLVEEIIQQENERE